MFNKSLIVKGVTASILLYPGYEMALSKKA